jgi:hypothetical protein
MTAPRSLSRQIRDIHMMRYERSVHSIVTPHGAIPCLLLDVQVDVHPWPPATFGWEAYVVRY